ncbi:TPA: hypothetical protein ACH3X1_007364 [Trebouxia sp. C0004]
MPSLPARGHMLDLGPLSPNMKHVKKDSMLATLSKLGERDTQQKAIDELRSMITALNEDSLGVLVSCLCATGTEQKVLARKECIRALGLLASPICPVQAQYLQQPFLGKVVNYLKSRMKDPDNTVREAAGDALGQIAEHSYGQHSVYSTGDIMSNSVLRAAHDTMLEHKKEVQQAGAYALSKVVCHTQPLVPSLWKTLLKLLNSNMFPGKATLIGAMARCDGDTWQPRGLVQGGLQALQPHLSLLIGQLQTAKSNSSGLVSALSNPDWPIRRAAADAIKALAIALGPDLDSPSQAALTSGVQSVSCRAAEALEKCRFDKVRPVREVVQEAQAVLFDLQEYASSGSSSSGWSAWLAPRLLARGITMSSPPHHRPVSPGRQSPTPRPTSALRRAGSHNSVHERFCMAAAKADQVADTTTRQQATSLQLAAEDSRSSTVISHTPAPVQHQQAASQGHTEAALGKNERSPGCRGSGEQTEALSTSEQIEQSANSAAGDSSDAAREEEGEPCRQDAAGAEARQQQISGEEAAGTEQAPGNYKSRHVNNGFSAETDHPHDKCESVSGTQTVSQRDMPASASDHMRVRPLRPPLAAVQEGSAPMLGSLSFKPTSMQRVYDEGLEGMSQNQAQASEPSKSRGRRLVKHTSLEERHQQQQNQQAYPASGAHQDSAAMTLQMQKLQEQQGRVLGMLDSLSHSTQTALAGLEVRLLALEAKAGACLPGYQGPVGATRTPGQSSLADANSSLQGNLPTSGALGASHLDQAFSQALTAANGDQHLIQLLTANSPAWQKLSRDTSSRLLLHLVMLIERQAGLAEVLPWMWPLADEDSGCTVHAAPSLQMRLLAALIAVPAGMDNALGGKVSLVDTYMLHLTLLLLAKVCCLALLDSQGPADRMSCYVAVQLWLFGRLLRLLSLYHSYRLLASTCG